MTGAGLQRFLVALPLQAALATFLVPAALSAEAAGASLLPYNVRIWQTDDGLPHNSVYALAQTPDGFLWVGTREGLARFDGLHFTPVQLHDVPGLRRAWITALYTTRDGSLWVAADGLGVIELREGWSAHFNRAAGLAGNHPRCFLQTPDGSLWIGTEEGLSRFRDGKFTTFTQKQGLGDNSVRGLCRDGQGRLRVATKRGLSTLLPDGNFTNSLQFGTSWVDNALRCIAKDQQGNLWVGSTAGLTSLGTGSPQAYGLKEGLPDQVINTICQDRRGPLWIGTYSGLACLSDGQVQARPSREAVFGDLVYSLFQDQEGSLWVGARDGLYRLTPARFRTYSIEQGLSSNNAMSVYEDPAGTLWVGLWGGGLDALRDGHIEAYASPTNRLARDSVLSLWPSRTGALWLGLEAGGGLEQFRQGRRLPVARDIPLLNNPILALREDRQGALWVGTRSGLVVLRDGAAKTYTTANGLAGHRVLALCEDHRGAMWIGTDGGLTCCYQGKFTSFTTRDGLSQNTVGALYEDARHVLWVGTHGGGLDRLEDGKFTAYTTRQGLFSDEIYEILADDFGFFWFSCRRGIFRVARREFDQLAEGQIGAVTCTVFGKADGLLSVQCNGVAKPAGWKGRDGRLWFPTIRGVVAVDSRLRTNARPPPLVIESVLADRKPARSIQPGPPSPDAQSQPFTEGWPAAFGSEPLRIRPGHGELEFSWTALSLQAPEKNRFKYILEGLDSSWTEVGSERTAHYNSVPPGSYRFRVLGCNNDGVWNLTGAEVALVLLPHFWQTWWFDAVMVLGLGVALGLGYRLRVGHVRELERLRVAIAANLHDDVGARLTKVAMLTEIVDQETPPCSPNKAHIQTISKTTGEVIQAMDEIVWTIDPKNDTLENLANYIFQYAQEYFEDTTVRCRLQMPPQLPDFPLSTDSRHHLFMAVKEALNNVLKHSGASEVRIAMSLADKRMTIAITDNGQGFKPNPAAPGGNGLSNMKHRLEKIGGTLRVETSPGRGTCLRMELEAS